MRTVFGRKRTMRSAADATYPLLGALVDRAQRSGGSRMTAYADVARSIGETGSWVRKFLGRQRVRLDADTYLKVQAEYERQCVRWEAEAEAQKARFFALRGSDDAMAKSTTERVAVEAGGRPPRAGRTAAVVAPVVGEGRR